MIQKILIGIDPGSSTGYICVMIVYNDGSVEPLLIAFKEKTPMQWASEIDDLITPFVGIVPIMAIVENVQYMPRQGKGGFNMYKNIGQIEMYLTLRKIPAEYVSAQFWQKFYIRRAGVKRFTPQKEIRLIREMRKQKISEEHIGRYIEEQKEKVKLINAQNSAKQKKHRFNMRYRAAQLFPGVKVDENNSQALLIAYTKLMEGRLVPIAQGGAEEEETEQEK